MMLSSGWYSTLVSRVLLGSALLLGQRALGDSNWAGGIFLSSFTAKSARRIVVRYT